MGTSSVNLPGEIIELILSRCPAKSIVRFKSVSKLWLSIISDPRFSRTHHIQRSKLSGNQNKFLVWAKHKQQQYRNGYTIYSNGYTIYLMSMDDGKFQTESVVMPPPYLSQDLDFEPPFPLCYCDGLFLFRAKIKRHDYMLWNPSIRKHTIIPSKTTDFIPSPWHHMYHDATTDDYKIVFCNRDYWYAVYSCKNESWGDMKQFPPDVPATGINVFVDGCLYVARDDEIVCFDLRVGKVHKFRQPNDVECCDTDLDGVSGRLCLYGLNREEGWPGYGFDLEVQKLQMWVMENNNGSFDKRWRKLICEDKVGKLKYLHRYADIRPLCLGNEDDVVFIASCPGMWQNFMYNPREKSLQEFDFTWTCCVCCPYSENLYMPSSNNMLM